MWTDILLKAVPACLQFEGSDRQLQGIQNSRDQSIEMLSDTYSPYFELICCCFFSLLSNNFLVLFPQEELVLAVAQHFAAQVRLLA